MTQRAFAAVALSVLLVIASGCGVNLFHDEVEVSIENNAPAPLTVSVQRDSCSSGDTIATTTVPGATAVTFQGAGFRFEQTEPWSLCVDGVLKFESTDYDPALAPYMIVRATEDGVVLVRQGSYL